MHSPKYFPITDEDSFEDRNGYTAGLSAGAKTVYPSHFVFSTVYVVTATPTLRLNASSLAENRSIAIVANYSWCAC